MSSSVTVTSPAMYSTSNREAVTTPGPLGMSVPGTAGELEGIPSPAVVGVAVIVDGTAALVGAAVAVIVDGTIDGAISGDCAPGPRVGDRVGTLINSDGSGDGIAPAVDGDRVASATGVEVFGS